MTRPAVTFPRPHPGINHTECSEASQRDPDESLSQPCHVCGHIVCGFGPDGPRPCEMCSMVIYVRQIFERTGRLETAGGAALQNLRNEAKSALDDLRTDATAGHQNNAAAIAQLRADATAAINQVRTDATTAITALAGRTTALENTRPTNAQLNTVNTKVDTLKTRVDNATAFPI